MILGWFLPENHLKLFCKGWTLPSHTKQSHPYFLFFSHQVTDVFPCTGEQIKSTSPVTDDNQSNEETTTEPTATNDRSDDNIESKNTGQSNEIMITHPKAVAQLIAMPVGFLSNLLSFSIIVKQGLIKSGVWVYFAAISVNDNLNIIWMFVANFSTEPFHILGEIITRNEFSCKLLNSGAYFWGVIRPVQSTAFRDRSLFMTGGAPEENNILREIFSRPTRRTDKKFRGPLDIARSFFDAHSSRVQ